jgi:hypothetical protein
MTLNYLYVSLLLCAGHVTPHELQTFPLCNLRPTEAHSAWHTSDVGEGRGRQTHVTAQLQVFDSWKVRIRSTNVSHSRGLSIRARAPAPILSMIYVPAVPLALLQ